MFNFYKPSTQQLVVEAVIQTVVVLAVTTAVTVLLDKATQK